MPEDLALKCYAKNGHKLPLLSATLDCRIADIWHWCNGAPKNIPKLQRLV